MRTVDSISLDTLDGEANAAIRPHRGPSADLVPLVHLRVVKGLHDDAANVTHYRSEREYGSFYRAVPLPEGVKLEDVKATFSDGVLEVSVPLPARPEANVRKVQVEEPKKAAKSAA
jgi:hypothetical protein